MLAQWALARFSFQKLNLIVSNFTQYILLHILNTGCSARQSKRQADWWIDVRLHLRATREGTGGIQHLNKPSCFVWGEREREREILLFLKQSKMNTKLNGTFYTSRQQQQQRHRRVARQTIEICCTPKFRIRWIRTGKFRFILSDVFIAKNNRSLIGI